MPPEKAFALSASALSGSDRYRVAGQVSIFDPNGVMAGKSRYEGEVTGHGNFNLKWSEGAPLVRIRAAGGQQSPARFQPLQLLDEVHHGTAQVVYADQPYADGNVRLLVKLNDNAAKRRVAEGLRAELSGLRTEIKGKTLSSASRNQAATVLDQAGRNLNKALSTLHVKTLCLWTADRNTWFPRQMKEETELAYEWNGKTLREKRVTETNFLRGGPNGTIRSKM
ncbi:MAG: hypothetical protein JWR03_361 [Cohnella sp.]|jgi:hypothetical protein|nr:hypothetical protein [Cohnella sp.]